jgi:hypothetical protein
MIDAYENMTPEEVSEGTVVFDDIYPKRIGTMSEVATKGYTDTDTDTGVVTNWNAYRFKDSGITFSKDYVIAGKELRIVFQSGSLNGCDFAVKFNPDGLTDESASGAQLFEIVRNDDYGVNLPNDTLKPIIGDTYVLYGFDTSLVSEVYLPAAEQELYDKATEWLTSNLKDKSTFSCPTIITAFAENDWNFNIGRNVKLVSPRFENGNRSSRIMGFEKRLINPYDCTYTVGDNATYSRLGTIEKNVDTALSLAKSNSDALASLSNIETVISSKGKKYFLSKQNDDTASGQITFKSGVVVQADSVDTISGGLMETSNAESTTVSGEVMETTSAEEATGKSLGDLTNVNSEVDQPSPYDVIFGRKAGAEKYSSMLLKDIHPTSSAIVDTYEDMLPLVPIPPAKLLMVLVLSDTKNNDGQPSEYRKYANGITMWQASVNINQI